MALNPLVSLFGRLVARSARIKGTGQTDGRTDGRTVTLAAHARLTDRNPRCACAPRVRASVSEPRLSYTDAEPLTRLPRVWQLDSCRRWPAIYIPRPYLAELTALFLRDPMGCRLCQNCQNPSIYVQSTPYINGALYIINGVLHI